MRRLLAIALWAAAPIMALADDPLSRFSPWFAAHPSGLVFHYSAPLEGFEPDAPTLQGPTDEGLRQALLDQDGIEPTTGLDLDVVDAVLTIGAPPEDLLVLMGEPAMSINIGPALIGRGFEKREVNGVPVFGSGEDHAMDLASAGLPDPFAGGMGKAQRVALGDGYVAVGRSWPAMEAALARLGDSRGAALVWQATLEALASLRENGRLDAAWGWGGDSFEGMLLDPATLLEGDIESAKDTVSGGPQLLFPPFPLAVFALDRDGTEASLRIALPYGRSEDAQAAANFVAAELVKFPRVPGPPDVAIVQQGELAVAILTLTYPDADVAEANALMLSWSAAVMQRNFTPLQFGLF